MFKHSLDNNLISCNQSSLKPGNSCINQLIAMTHDIFKVFDDGLEVRGVFLVISKALDKVWHEGLIYKLRRNGRCSNLLQLLLNFVDSRKQRVLLNDEFSSWGFINAKVSLGSILGPLFYYLYKRSNRKSLIKPKTFCRRLFFVYDNK